MKESRLLSTVLKGIGWVIAFAVGYFLLSWLDSNFSPLSFETRAVIAGALVAFIYILTSIKEKIDALNRRVRDLELEVENLWRQHPDDWPLPGEAKK